MQFACFDDLGAECSKMIMASPNGANHAERRPSLFPSESRNASLEPQLLAPPSPTAQPPSNQVMSGLDLS